MCGRFTQAFTWAEVVAFYQLVDEIAPSLSASWNVAPTHNAGVIVLGRDGLRFQPMRWGLVPSWAKDPSIGSKLINARCETLAEKPAFRRALKSRRCIVPISGFYEWQRQGRGKQPYFVTSVGGEPLTLAGLWEEWNGHLTFTVITVPANEKVAAIHDRMPAVLSREDAFAWLKTADTALLKPCHSDALATWTVSTRVNSPANNDPALADKIAPASEEGATAPAQEQTGQNPEQLSLLV
jgi:putative SOS response-associated peptidase YedK